MNRLYKHPTGPFARAFLLLTTAALAGCSDDTSVATHTVQARTFSHRITAEGTLRTKTSTMIAVPSEASRGARISWMAPDGTLVRKGDVIARFDPTELERQLEDGESDHAKSRLRLDRAELDGTVTLSGIEKDRQLAVLEESVAERYQKTDELIYSRHEIIESQIDGSLATDRRLHADDMQEIQVDLTDAELALIDIEKRRAQVGIDEARVGLRALQVQVPHDGILTWKRDWRGDIPEVGQQVWKGQPLAEIPSLEEMQAELYVLEADAGGLAEDKAVEVRVDAHPMQVIAGAIATVEAVAKPRFRGSPVQYFGVIADLESSDSDIMKPGQRVTATLILAERKAALVIPRQALQLGDDGVFVYVRKSGKFHEIKVQLGEQTTAEAVVLDGLVVGDVVAIERPPEDQIIGHETTSTADRETNVPKGPDTLTSLPDTFTRSTERDG